jgi:hypothetical protein
MKFLSKIKEISDLTGGGSWYAVHANLPIDADIG